MEEGIFTKESMMSEKSTTGLNQPVKARRDVCACDQGHYGSTSCSNCGADVEKHPGQCPNCQAVFEEKDNIMGGFGGSDF